jgi:hypothetical protein
MNRNGQNTAAWDRGTIVRMLVALSPGLLVFLQSLSIWNQMPRFLIPILIMLPIAGAIVDIRSEGKVQPWHLPTIGAIAWEIRWLALGFLGLHGASLVMDVLTVALLAVVLRMAARQRLRIPPRALVVATALLLLFGLESSTVGRGWLLLLGLNLLGWCVRVAPFIVRASVDRELLGPRRGKLRIVAFIESQHSTSMVRLPANPIDRLPRVNSRGCFGTFSAKYCSGMVHCLFTARHWCQCTDSCHSPAGSWHHLCSS